MSVPDSLPHPPGDADAHKGGRVYVFGWKIRCEDAYTRYLPPAETFITMDDSPSSVRFNTGKRWTIYKLTEHAQAPCPCVHGQDLQFLIGFVVNTKECIAKDCKGGIDTVVDYAGPDETQEVEGKSVLDITKLAWRMGGDDTGPQWHYLRKLSQPGPPFHHD
ncbi:hypothetical protein EIP91_010112 [Steccherinum ochraceum]|uniref:Uncharacterized protein n=1 Tax=Steccherinum ochraceum TaxID=92696 RepID=A0A4R0RTW3_9APHY|nr:hypothetical protein EIP91_010112 [Steccherinum ochraceum]